MIDVHDYDPVDDASGEGDGRPDAFRVAASAEGLACDEGAAILRDRIAERQWVTAAAVVSGDQPGRDPDARFVAEVGDGYRVYRFPAEGDGGDARVVRKTLVDGLWRAVAGELD